MNTLRFMEAWTAIEAAQARFVQDVTKAMDILTAAPSTSKPEQDREKAAPDTVDESDSDFLRYD